MVMEEYYDDTPATELPLYTATVPNETNRKDASEIEDVIPYMLDSDL